MRTNRLKQRWPCLLAIGAVAAIAWCAAPPAGDPVRRFRLSGPPKHSIPLKATCYSPDGRMLAVGCLDRTVRVLDGHSGKELLNLSKLKESAEVLAFSPDGKVLAGFSPTDIALWSLPSGKRQPLRDGIKGFVRAITFLRDGRLAVARAENRLYLIDPRTGKSRLAAHLDGEPGTIRGLVARVDTALVAVWQTWRFGVIDITTGKATMSTLPGKPKRTGGAGGFLNFSTAAITSALLTPGGRACVARLWYPSYTVVAWPPGAARWHLMHDLVPGEPDSVQSSAVAISPSGRVVAVGGADALHLRELATGKCFASAPYSAGAAEGLAFSPCGRSLAVVRDDLSPVVEVRDLDAMLSPLPPCATAADRAGRWAELSSADALTGQRALAALARRAEADKVAEGRLVLTEAGRRRVERLVRDLDADGPDRREGAHKALAALGQAAGPSMRRALAAKPSAEARRRLTALVGFLDGPAAWGRHGRALDLLERRATPAAARVLKAIAAQKDGGWFSLEAGEALARMRPRLAPKP